MPNKIKITKDEKYYKNGSNMTIAKPVYFELCLHKIEKYTLTVFLCRADQITTANQHKFSRSREE